MNINDQVIELIANDVQEFTEFARNFAKSRFAVLTTEFGSNQEELDAINHLADTIKVKINKTDSGVSLSVYYDDDYEYLDVIQNGMEAPLSGGNNGIVTNPDGSKTNSNVPRNLWGQPLDEYAKEGEDVIGEIRMMLTDIFKERVQEAVTECKPQIANIAKSYLSKEIQERVNQHGYAKMG